MPIKKTMKRGKRRIDLVVHLLALEMDRYNVIRLVNEMPGPQVKWDTHRKCYGLRSDRPYRKGELVTTYGGTMSVREIAGDYVAKASEVYIDGESGFRLSQKGRWINESDRDRTSVNVSLGRNIRATRDIAEGEWLFADYGPDYIRSY